MRRMDAIRKRFLKHSDERDTNKFVDDIHYMLGTLDDYRQLENKVFFMIRTYADTNATKKQKKNAVKDVMMAYHTIEFNKW